MMYPPTPANRFAAALMAATAVMALSAVDAASANDEMGKAMAMVGIYYVILPLAVLGVIGLYAVLRLCGALTSAVMDIPVGIASLAGLLIYGAALSNTSSNTESPQKREEREAVYSTELMAEKLHFEKAHWPQTREFLDVAFLELDAGDGRQAWKALTQCSDYWTKNDLASKIRRYGDSDRRSRPGISAPNRALPGSKDMLGVEYWCTFMVEPRDEPFRQLAEYVRQHSVKGVFEAYLDDARADTGVIKDWNVLRRGNDQSLWLASNASDMGLATYMVSNGHEALAVKLLQRLLEKGRMDDAALLIGLLERKPGLVLPMNDNDRIMEALFFSPREEHDDAWAKQRETLVFRLISKLPEADWVTLTSHYVEANMNEWIKPLPPAYENDKRCIALGGPLVQNRIKTLLSLRPKSTAATRKRLAASLIAHAYCNEPSS